MGNQRENKIIGLDRIKILFKEAGDAFKKNPSRSHRYVSLALRIAAKTGVSIPRSLRRRYCRVCKKYLVSGVNSRFRTRDGKLVVYCFGCKKYKKMILKFKKSK